MFGCPWCPVTWWTQFWMTALESAAYKRHGDFIERRHPPGPTRDAAYQYHAEMIDDYYHPSRSPWRQPRLPYYRGW